MHNANRLCKHGMQRGGFCILGPARDDERMRTRQPVAILWGVALAVLVADAPVVFAGPVEELIDRLQESARSIRTVYVRGRTRRRSSYDILRAATETWMVRQDGVTRMRKEETVRVTDLLSDPVRFFSYREIEVIDGEQRWRQRDSDGKITVVRQSVSPKEPLAALDWLCEQTEASILPAEQLLGERCAVIRFVAGQGNQRDVTTVWVSERTGVLLKTLVEESDGTVTRVMALAFEVDAPIDASRFDYTPPPGVSVRDLDARDEPVGSKEDRDAAPTSAPAPPSGDRLLEVRRSKPIR